jgi:hypothetical protein
MMKRVLFLAVFFSCAFVFAQESPGAEESPKEGGVFLFRTNQKGDQWIKIDLMVDIPLAPDVNHLKVGGMGALGYHRFLNPFLAIGGDIGFAYNVTVGSNIFTFIPLMFKVTCQPVHGKFEFPISLGAGVAFENYIDRTYFGVILKPEAAAYWRVLTEWSFGLRLGLYIMPQWYSNSNYNYTGLLLDAGISGRYHF